MAEFTLYPTRIGDTPSGGIEADRVVFQDDHCLKGVPGTWLVDLLRINVATDTLSVTSHDLRALGFGAGDTGPDSSCEARIWYAGSNKYVILAAGLFEEDGFTDVAPVVGVVEVTEAGLVQVGTPTQVSAGANKEFSAYHCTYNGTVHGRGSVQGRLRDTVTGEHSWWSVPLAPAAGYVGVTAVHAGDSHFQHLLCHPVTTYGVLWSDSSAIDNTTKEYQPELHPCRWDGLTADPSLAVSGIVPSAAYLQFTVWSGYNDSDGGLCHMPDSLSRCFWSGKDVFDVYGLENVDFAGHVTWRANGSGGLLTESLEQHASNPNLAPDAELRIKTSGWTLRQWSWAWPTGRDDIGEEYHFYSGSRAVTFTTIDQIYEAVGGPESGYDTLQDYIDAVDSELGMTPEEYVAAVNADGSFTNVAVAFHRVTIDSEVVVEWGTSTDYDQGWSDVAWMCNGRASDGRWITTGNDGVYLWGVAPSIVGDPGGARRRFVR